MPGGVPRIRAGFRTGRGLGWERQETASGTAAREGAASTRAGVVPPVIYAVRGIYISVVRIDCTEEDRFLFHSETWNRDLLYTLHTL